jgi:hypothetical protein
MDGAFKAAISPAGKFVAMQLHPEGLVYLRRSSTHDDRSSRPVRFNYLQPIRTGEFRYAVQFRLCGAVGLGELLVGEALSLGSRSILKILQAM